MNDENELNELNPPVLDGYTKIPTFKLWVANNFPYMETDFDGLTNYDLMGALTDYLNNVIKNEENVESNVARLNQAYLELFNYVKDYFDNLDVQEEINNKLDDLVEDGTLTNLISTYVQPLIDEQNQEISEFKSQVNAQMQALESGSPLVASSVQGMTDTTRVYVNTTDGNWYYYNGTAWTIGGVYQASEDSNTLNIVKDKQNIMINDEYFEKKSSDFVIGGISMEGFVNNITNRFRGTKYLKNVDLIYCDEDYSFLVWKFDNTNEIVGRWNGTEFSGTGSAVWVKVFDISKYADENLRIVVKKDDDTDVSSADFDKITLCYKNDKTVGKLLYQGEKLYERLTKTACQKFNDDGWVYIAPNTQNELYTYKIELFKGQKIKLTTRNLNRCRIVVYNEFGTVIKENAGGLAQTTLCDNIIVYDDNLTEYETVYEATHDEETIYMFLGSNQEPVIDINYILNNIEENNEDSDFKSDIDFYIPASQTNQYANNTLTSMDLFDIYDEMLGIKDDGYKVTKDFLGKDQSDTYDIYKYVFEPPNYTRTIILSTGMHGIEITPVFTVLTLMQNIVNTPGINDFTKYLREKVRIIVIPTYNPWGFNQNPRVYPNSRWVNTNRNFGMLPEWEAFNAPAYGNAENPYQGKGTAPFSEKETQIMRDVLINYKDECDFWFDCHTSMGWDVDYYVQCNTNDKYMHDGIANGLDFIINYLRNNQGIQNPTGLFNDPNTALKLHYAYNMFNVSCCTVEMTPERFGGQECGSIDIKMYMLMLSSYIIGALNEFSLQNKINNNHKYSANKDFIILNAPNGDKYQVHIDNTGNLITTKV